MPRSVAKKKENSDTVSLGFRKALDPLREFLGMRKGGEASHVWGTVPHVSRAAVRSSHSSWGCRCGNPPTSLLYPQSHRGQDTGVAATMGLFKICKAEHASANLN